MVCTEITKHYEILEFISTNKWKSRLVTKCETVLREFGMRTISIRSLRNTYLIIQKREGINNYCNLTVCQLSIAYFLVHSLAFRMASLSLIFQSSATSFANGSSGLGALSRAWIDSRTVRICRAGLHLSFKISKHILPNLSIFGW